MTREIRLSQGKVALVDDDDYEWLSQWKWSFAQGYASRAIGPVNARRHIRMQNMIIPPPDGMEVDHKDLDPLNNTRLNLRVAPHISNTWNRRRNSRNTSGYKGVSLRKTKRHGDKWGAFITVNGKVLYLGSYTDKRDAARAYNKAAREHFGEFARVNDIRPCEYD